MSFEIICFNERPEMKERMADWFCEKWGIPRAEYIKSMDESLCTEKAYPKWYVAVENGDIIGGIGVIENDFHDKKELYPNVCALYVEKENRNRGIAGNLINRVCVDMSNKGIKTLYLVTDHTSFYEKYGWEYYCDVTCYGETKPSRMYIHKT